MASYEDFFKGKQVTLMGLGLLGRGVGDAEFLAQCGALVTVTDIKDKTALQTSVKKLEGNPNISFHLGKHELSDFTTADMVIKAAGVPLDSLEIKAARKAGVPVYMSTALFAKFAEEAGARLVGVTGTRGKSTVAHMIYDALKHAGRRAVLGGNIRGLSTLSLLPDIQKDDIAVLELDSWQLQGFGDFKISPHIAIFTNLMPDHMNYYGGDMKLYFADKANIFRNQKEGDLLLAGQTILADVQKAKPQVAPIVPNPIAPDWNLKVVGEHNRENAAFAAAALASLGLSEDEVRAGIESFEPVEGRLQFVRTVRGVKIYNDNNATTPDATIAALRALDAGAKNIVLVAGGSDKGLELSKLVEEMNRVCKKVVLVYGSGTDRLSRWFNAPVYNTLQVAIHNALALCSEGDVLLFSPAFASFGMFKNEYERNDEFMRVLNAL